MAKKLLPLAGILLSPSLAVASDPSGLGVVLIAWPLTIISLVLFLFGINKVRPGLAFSNMIIAVFSFVIAFSNWSNEPEKLAAWFLPPVIFGVVGFVLYVRSERQAEAERKKSETEMDHEAE